MKRLMVFLVTSALLVSAAAAGVVMLGRDPPTSTRETCERLTRAELPPRGSARVGDRHGLFVPGSGATHLGDARAMYVGDLDAGRLATAFRSGDCVLTVRFPAGTRMPEARAWLRHR